jgi:hypothetical protein
MQPHDSAKMLVAFLFGEPIAANRNHGHCFLKDMNNIYKYKSYAHFDAKKSYSPWKDYIENPSMISKHGFYPFVHFILKSWKYDNEKDDTYTK